MRERESHIACPTVVRYSDFSGMPCPKCGSELYSIVRQVRCMGGRGTDYHLFFDGVSRELDWLRPWAEAAA